MIYQATQSIYNALVSENGLKVFTEETERSSYVWVQFGLKGGSSYRIRFISNDDDNDVAVRVFALVSDVPEDKKASILEVVNELNAQFRYAKFALDKDNDVNVEYDYPVRCSNPAESAKEIIVRFVDIIEKSFPRLMTALWA